MLLRLCPIPKIIWVYDPKVVLLSSKWSNSFTTPTVLLMASVALSPARWSISDCKNLMIWNMHVQKPGVLWKGTEAQLITDSMNQSSSPKGGLTKDIFGEN